VPHVFLSAVDSLDSQYYAPEYYSLEDYTDEDVLRKKIPSLCEFNDITKHDPSKYKDANFFIIRSKQMEDIHKAIKYGVWTSSSFNNKKFADAWFTQVPVIFLFTIMKTSRFVGIAKVEDRPMFWQEFPYWGEIGRWKGVIKIKFLYVRDLYFDKIPGNLVDDATVYEWKDGL
jgi:hypothetical protein